MLMYLFTKKQTIPEAKRLAEKVNESVFANENMNYALHNNQSTGVGTNLDGLAIDAQRDFELRRDAMLAVFQQLSDEIDAKVVYVRYPFPPSNRDMDEVPRDIEEDAVAWMDELGAGYLDMRALDLDDTQYEDMRHMTRQGAQVFTAAIGRALVVMDAMGEGQGVRVIRGLEAPVEPELMGELPALPSVMGATLGEDCRIRVPAGVLSGLDQETLARLGGHRPPFVVTQRDASLDPWARGEGCVGGAWVEGGQLVISPSSPTVDGLEVKWDLATETGVRWVVPGAGLLYRFDEAWTLPANTFRVYGRALKTSDRGDVIIRVEDEQFKLREIHGRMAAVARLTPPEQGGWELEVSATDETGFVALHHLAVGVAPTTTYLMGAPETLHGASVRVVGGRSDDVEHAPTFAAAPPSVPHQPRVRRGIKGAGLLDMTPLADLADAPEKNASRPNRCSPIRVLEDGQPLQSPHSTCFETVNRKGGRSCFAGEIMYFAASDGTNPILNQRTYQLTLGKSRRCYTLAQRGAATLRDSWWLYPKDVATLEIPASRTREFLDGINEVEFEVIPHVSEVNVPLIMKVFHDGRLLVEKQWTPEGKLRHRRHRIAIEPPLAPRAGGLRVEISNPSRSFILLSMLAIGEDYGVFAIEDEVPVMRDGQWVSRQPTAAMSTASRQVVPRSSRVGEPTAVAAPKKQGRSSIGGTDARMFPLWPISTTVLQREGRGIVTPVRLRADGQDLVPRVTKRGLRSGCEACFLHQGQSLVYHAPAGEAAVLEVYYDERFPFVAPDGQLAWWLYPGTLGRFDVEEPWAGGQLTVVAHGHAFHPQRDDRGRGIDLRVGGARAAFEPAGDHGALRAELEISAETMGPWAMEIVLDQPDAFFLIDRLQYMDADGTAVLLPRTPDEMGLSDPVP
jgi:hypothetical protein